MRLRMSQIAYRQKELPEAGAWSGCGGFDGDGTHPDDILMGAKMVQKGRRQVGFDIDDVVADGAVRFVQVTGDINIRGADGL